MHARHHSPALGRSGRFRLRIDVKIGRDDISRLVVVGGGSAVMAAAAMCAAGGGFGMKVR
jgi:hypothetical protein